MAHRPGDSGQPPQYPPQGQPWPPQQPGSYPGQQPAAGQPQGQGYGPPPQVPPWQQPGARLQQMPLPRKRHVVRNVLAGIGAVVVAIVAIAAAANSGHHTVNTTGNTPASGTPAAARGSGTAPRKTATIGSAITLAGNDSGEQAAVTVTKVISSARGADEFSAAPAGDRLYAVQFRLHDTGSTAYSDSPSNGAAVTDSAGQSYQSGVDTAAGCQEFPATENIAAGGSGLGCVVFEVPKAARIVSVQFTLDSGFGPQTGQWSVGA